MGDGQSTNGQCELLGTEFPGLVLDSKFVAKQHGWIEGQ